ncbi:hypothetical protein [Streptomyces smyrnaeus]|uniref:hypothetical protein n=1 Tax=Streptomyces smyrnaeus TaxID=1387713 RepID=UPI0036B87D09
MTTTPKKQNGDNCAFAPGTYVYDVVRDALGRVADPRAYPSEHLGPEATLIVPIHGNAPAWRAEPATLRLANEEEIKAAK